MDWAEAARTMAEQGHDDLLDQPTTTCFDRGEWEWL
jgi:hypothetical protein